MEIFDRDVLLSPWSSSAIIDKEKTLPSMLTKAADDEQRNEKIAEPSAAIEILAGEGQ